MLVRLLGNQHPFCRMYWHRPDTNKLIEELRKRGPWWDHKQGADHIFTVTADPGRCEFQDPSLRNAIFLHHFGMLRKFEGWNGECNLFDKWGAQCDPLMTVGMDAIQGRAPQGCHIPGQDIVVPPSPYEDEDGTPVERMDWPTPYVGERFKGLERTYKLYYAGKIDLHKDDKDALAKPWSDAHYSFGTRQTVFRMFHDVPGFEVRTDHSHGTYWRDLSSSIFCLSTPGWAWGGRTKVAVTRGCIPVVVQDGIKVEWEEQLPLQDYAIRVPVWLVHKLPDILDTYIQSGRVARMQKVLECAWRLHWWRRPYGRAFEVVMCELKRRVLGAAPGHISVDWEKCELRCGDDRPVALRETFNNV